MVNVTVDGDSYLVCIQAFSPTKLRPSLAEYLTSVCCVCIYWARYTGRDRRLGPSTSLVSYIHTSVFWNTLTGHLPVDMPVCSKRDYNLYSKRLLPKVTVENKADRIGVLPNLEKARGHLDPDEIGAVPSLMSSTTVMV